MKRHYLIHENIEPSVEIEKKQEQNKIEINTGNENIKNIIINEEQDNSNEIVDEYNYERVSFNRPIK